MPEIQPESVDEFSPNVEHDPVLEINLDDMGDRFKVVEYLLKLRDNPPFAGDLHPAACFVAQQVAAFADEQMRLLMGAQAAPAAKPLSSFSEEEEHTLKGLASVGGVLLELVTELQRPVQQRPQPTQLPATRPAPQPGPNSTVMSHIPGRRSQSLPQTGTVRHGPMSRPPLSKEDMEATTHAQAQIVANRARRAFMTFGTGANSGRDGSER